MAGHSKWANIKRHKAKQDAMRSKIYTKVIREVTVAARLGGADPNANPRLRAALDKAQEVNMSKDVLERAIKRGAQSLPGEEVEEIRYEGYGPGGVALMVDCITNNRNRTVADVRHLFSKLGGNLGSTGAVSYLFTKQGQITFAPTIDADRLLEASLEAGALDMIINEDYSIDVLTAPETFSTVKEALVKAKFKPEQAEITMLPTTTVMIEDKETAEVLLKLIDSLEELDDVQAVYANSDIKQEILKEL